MTEESNPRRPRRTARRAATAFALAGVAALALGACQVQPGAAAFVGGDRISRSQVDQVTDNVKAGAQTDYGSIRQQTVAALVTADLAGRLATEHGVTVKTPDYQAAVTKVALFSGAKLTTGSPFVRAVAQADAAIDALRPVAQPAKPTEADLELDLEVLEALGVAQPGTPIQAVADQLDTPEAEQAVGVRAELARAAHTYHVSINPVYGQIAYPVSVPYGGGQVTGAIPLQLGSPSTAPVTSATASPNSGTGE